MDKPLGPLNARVPAMRPLLLLCLPLGLLLAQPTLRITSPANGTVVNPGQSLTVTVAASGGTFQQVIIIGWDPIGFSGVLTAPPYQFTIQIPSRIDPGIYLLTADGATAPGQGTSSEPIGIVVEPADPPLSLRVEPPLFKLSVGQRRYLSVTGLFSDGTNVDLTKSSRIVYASDTPSVATVQAQGLVTAVAAGSAVITATYGSLSFPVPVTVPRGLNIAPRGTSLHAAETQQFTAQPTGLSNPTIAWSVSPGGAGSVDGTGLYTAPSSIPVRRTVTITATDTANNTQFATATVILFPPLTVTTAPSAVSLTSSQTQKFTATVTNALNTGVSWAMTPSSAGSIDRTGLYTAPGSIPSPQTVTVIATSWEDPRKSGSATIALLPHSIR